MISQTMIATNVPAAGGSENAPVLTASTANRYRISAVASFASPSPSRMTRMRWGSFNRLAMASGATTSGGDTIAPRTNPTLHGSPSA